MHRFSCAHKAPIAGEQELSSIMVDSSYVVGDLSTPLTLGRSEAHAAAVAPGFGPVDHAPAPWVWRHAHSSGAVGSPCLSMSTAGGLDLFS